MAEQGNGSGKARALGIVTSDQWLDAGRARLIHAEYELATGLDPSHHLEHSREALNRALLLEPTTPRALLPR